MSSLSRALSRALCTCFAVALLHVPALAQSNSDGGGSGSDVSGSDVSGVSSELSRAGDATFASPVVQQRMNAAAGLLRQRLQSGAFLSSNDAVSPQAASAPGLARLLSSANDVDAERQTFVQDLTVSGLQNESALALGNAVSGLLSDETLKAPDYVRAVDAFNAAVDSAPASFLRSPPNSFLVVREVLVELNQASTQGR